MSAFGRCTICTLSFQVDDFYALKCGHTYHNECITTWISKHTKNCPQCRMKNTLHDIIRLFVEDPDKTASFIDSAPSTTELEQKIRQLEVQLQQCNDAKLASEISLKTSKKHLEKLQRQLENERKNSIELVTKNELISHLEGRIKDQEALRAQLNNKKAQLKASEFYSLLSKKSNATDETIEKAIDKYVHRSGLVDVGEFLKLVRKQYVQAEAKNKEFGSLLRQERMEKNKLTKDLEDIKKDLRKRPVTSSCGESPASQPCRRSRQSMGFSFADIEEQQTPSQDDSDIQIISGPSIRNTKKTLSKEPTTSSRAPLQPFNFHGIDARNKKTGTTNKEPYLGEELNEIFSSKLLAHAENSNLMH